MSEKISLDSSELLSMNLFLGICSENQFRKNLSHFCKNLTLYLSI